MEREQQYVGIDLHRRRSVIVRMNDAGEVVGVSKAQIHAVMAKLGIIPPMADMFCASGQVLLDDMDFPGPYGLRVESLRDLLEVYGTARRRQ